MSPSPSHSPFDQGEVGLSATLIFEAPTGERASSHLELHNEGSTAIFYSWEQLPVTRSFPIQRPRTKSQHFYFNSSSGTHQHSQTPACLALTPLQMLSAPLGPSYLYSSAPPLRYIFASSPHPGVIRPGDAQRVEFIFKSEESGIQSEVWQLNTHPVLLRGASMQLALRGVALYQDNTADQRLFIEVETESETRLRFP